MPVEEVLPSPIEVRLDGLAPLTVHIHATGDEHVSRRIASEGVWEPFETTLVRRLIRPGDLVVDAGANLGWFSLVLARCGARVVACEPMPANADLLEANVTANGLAGLIKVHRVGLGAATDSATLELSSRNQGDHRVTAAPTGRKPTVTIPIVPLDDVVAGRRVDLLKMDTQGSEVAILRGGRSAWHSPDVVVVTEFWPYGLQCAGAAADDLIDLLAELVPASHACFQIHEWACALTPLTTDELRSMAAAGGFSVEMKGFANLLLVPHSRVGELDEWIRPPFEF